MEVSSCIMIFHYLKTYNNMDVLRKYNYKCSFSKEENCDIV